MKLLKNIKNKFKNRNKRGEIQKELQTVGDDLSNKINPKVQSIEKKNILESSFKGNDLIPATKSFPIREEDVMDVKRIQNKPNKNFKSRTSEDTNTISIGLNRNEIRKLKKANNVKRKGPKVIKNSEDMAIETINLYKSYVSGNVATKVLKEVNLKIPKGDFVVFFGKSGSGKSTLLNLISGLDRASAGEIIVNDHALQNMSSRELTKFRREQLSFIFQSYNLLQNLSARDNVDTGAYLQKDKSRKLDIDELFKELELEEVIDKFPAQMSGGQQQRISILRALAKNPNIIFADEPTGALDKKTSAIVLQVLKNINVKYGTTIIMVSHDPDVAKICKRVISIVDGKIDHIRTNENPKTVAELWG